MKKVLSFFLMLLVSLLCGCSCNSLILASYYNICVQLDGVRHFSYANSDYGITRYLTFYNGGREGKTILDLFEYEDAIHHFERYGNTNEKIHFESVLFSIKYDELVFERAISFIRNEPGFDNSFSWSYGSYSFFVNKTADMKYNVKKLDYQFEENRKTIKWFNGVGFFEEEHTICFIGLYYRKYESVSKVSEGNGFEFTSWEQLYNEFFSFYDWFRTTNDQEP